MTMSGLGISTVSSICQEVCQVLVDHLLKETVSSHMLQTEEGFKQKILDLEILAISSLLDSNKWLPYSYGMLAWRTSGMQRVPSFPCFFMFEYLLFMMNTGLK